MRSVALFVLPLVLLWAVPLIVAAGVFPLLVSVETRAVVGALPTFSVIGERSDSSDESVVVSVSLAPPPDIRVKTSGTISALGLLAPGDDIPAGGDLLRVDGVAIRAYTQATPLYRDLTFGDRGSDVASLTSFLTSTGYLADGPSEAVTQSVSDAIRKYQRDIGAVADGIFRPQYVVFLPVPNTRLGSWKVSVGEAVETDVVIAEGLSVPTEIVIASATQGRPIPIDLTESAVNLSAGDRSITLNSSVVVAADLSATYEFLQGAAIDGAITRTVNSEDQVIYSPLSLALSEPKVVGTIPASAVYVNSVGDACVAFATGSPSGPPARLTKLLAPQAIVGELGLVAVDKELSGKTVVTDQSSFSDEMRASCK